VDTLFLPEERHEFPGRREPSPSIAVRGSTVQPHCLHESIVMVVRERDQGGVTLDSTNGNATFTTTIDFTASDGSVAAGHDATHVPKEAVGGYYVFEADDLDAATELALLLALLEP
jgi:hypothetical protein